MVMDLEQGIERVLLGEAMGALATACQEEMLESVGLDPREALPETFRAESRSFIKMLCRALGEKHSGDHRALAALRDWVREVNDYEAWDALLTHFEFDGKDTLIRRGRVLFAGPMTAHWSDGGR